MSVDWKRIRHVFLDMDGTIYLGGQLFESTLPFLKTLERLGVGHTFLTNNTSKNRADYVAKLNALEISTNVGDIFTAADHFIAWAKANVPETTRLCIVGTSSLATQLSDAGFVDDWNDPQAVLIGYDPKLLVDHLGKAAYWIDRGRPFYATHPDLVCPTDQPTMQLDCGAVCACVSAATGRTPRVFGKPSADILHTLCSSLSIEPSEAVMIGDRIYTDIAMALNAGVGAVLVLSGEATSADVAASGITPDYIATDVGEIGLRLLEAC